MSKKKHIFATLAALILLLGDYLFWTVERPVANTFPEELWTATDLRGQLYYYDKYLTLHEIPVEEEMLANILAAVRQTEGSRRNAFQTISQPCFSIYLYYQNGHGYSSLTVVENGDIRINPTIKQEPGIYFDGGEELYQTLLALTET
ncbi:MAG: hypothetical protein IJB59_05365 [Oscillospiraceae bacterium]|nr:hypothetical protein [Oscillospiraceae bacterium]